MPFLAGRSGRKTVLIESCRRYLLAGVALVLLAALDFLLLLCFFVVFLAVVLLEAAGVCAAGVWAASIAPTLSREAKISLFTLVLLCEGLFPPRNTILPLDAKINDSLGKGIPDTKMRGASRADFNE
jgi:hypothetical protein